MMYRLLIVDDEQVIRQKLSGFPWEENEKGGGHAQSVAYSAF